MLLTISDITNLESFRNSNNVISLNCIILGDNFDDIFTLEISCIYLDNGIFLLEINISTIFLVEYFTGAMAEIYNKEVRGTLQDSEYNDTFRFRRNDVPRQISAVRNYHVLGLLGSSLDVLLSAM
ncbi:unnamed protein product [Rhizophagus irregularis]|nr:unnamed protein product [Rhizophagus irregularis]